MNMVVSPTKGGQLLVLYGQEPLSNTLYLKRSVVVNISRAIYFIVQNENKNNLYTSIYTDRQKKPDIF